MAVGVIFLPFNTQYQNMPEYLIDVATVESLQMINDTDELDRTFTRARSTIVQGGTVVLARKSKNGSMARFDEISTEPNLEQYRLGVFKYLK
jgi:hypothetical protein